MHSGQPYFLGSPMQPLADQSSYYMQDVPISSHFNGGITPKPLLPFYNVDIQPSDACPRNYVIFDQASHRSQITFHPEISSKILYPDFGFDTILQDKTDQKVASNEIELTTPFKEDSNDIDALLSSENDDDETEECDDDEVSTARTCAIYECNSPDSCSNYESKSGKSRDYDKKRLRMRKMVKALKGIVPGANRMSTVAVLDEAVRYLKSLKVEVKKMGVGNSEGLSPYNIWII